MSDSIDKSARARFELARWRAPLLRIAVTLLLLYLFYRGARTHADVVNTVASTKDQSAYLALARDLAQGYLVNDGARGPLSFWLIAQAWTSQSSAAEYFARAKTIMLLSTLVALAAFAASAYGTLSRRTADVLVLAVSFSVCLFYAGYVKSEASFYYLLGAAFLLLLHTLRSPSLVAGLTGGLLLAAAQLLKASAALLLPVYLLALLLSCVLLCFRGKEATFIHVLRGPELARRVATGAFAVAGFVALTATTYADNERRFGAANYNVNTTFYVYYDSWGEVVAGTRGYQDRTGYPDMAPERLPTAAKYFAHKPLERAWQRLQRGFLGNLKNSIEAWGFLRYCVAASMLLLGCAVAYRRRHVSLHYTLPLYVMVAGVLVTTGAASLWFYAVHPGLRFILAVVVLLLCGFTYLLDHCYDAATTLPEPHPSPGEDVAAEGAGEVVAVGSRWPAPRNLLVFVFLVLLTYDIPINVFWGVYGFGQAGW